jgi:RNA polymerase sigma-70 factor, ECF subfamily
MDAGSLCEVFWKAAPSERWSEADRERVARRLADATERVAQAWSGVSVDAEHFVRYLAERFPETADPVAALEEHRLEELYLCCACLAGSSAAHHELERCYLAESTRALGQLGLDADETLQLAREKLLAGSPPKLAQYTGRGRLAGWIRVVVVRTALNQRRAERRHSSAEDGAVVHSIADDSRDPELDVIRAQYGETLAAAVAQAFRQLTSEQRNLLRLYVIDGLSLADLARIHAVDPSTVSRWLAKIRTKLLNDARERLLERFAMRPSECESVIRLVKSDLHVSVARLLRTETPEMVDG